MKPSLNLTVGKNRAIRVAAVLLAGCGLTGFSTLMVSAPAANARAARGSRPAVSGSTPTVRVRDLSDAFFRDAKVPRIKIQISEAEVQRLRQNNREYVRCTVIENDGTKFQQVGIHLKGAAGSFRPLEDKPALTLNFDKFKKDQTFHALDKIHLNNSVQDPSYLNELVSSELFLAAGVPAPRVTHARVWLNGRDLGFYVLKEGFNKRFLKRHFAEADGNLYEGPFAQDIDGGVILMNGKGAKNFTDVKAVVNACRNPDPAKGWQRLAQVVDIDRFLTFMAMEMMTCHWDGYCSNRNNYRFYFEPRSGKMVFLPGGMDQMFQDPSFRVVNAPMNSLVTRAVMSNPQWRSRYRQRVTQLRKLFVPADPLLKRADENHRRLRPVLMAMGPSHAVNFDHHVNDFKRRLTARANFLSRPETLTEPRALSLKPGAFHMLKNWEPRVETPDARTIDDNRPGGQAGARILGIAAGPGGRCVASWRTRVLLSAGKYRFMARARTKGVRALQEPIGVGAGIRISGSSRNNKLEGTKGWTQLTHNFQIQQPMQEVILVAELRAAAGTAHFDASSMRLVRLGN